MPNRPRPPSVRGLAQADKPCANARCPLRQSGPGDPDVDLSKVEIRALIKELSIISHVSLDDPPTFMSYGMKPNNPIPSDPKQARNCSIHHVNFGIAMEEKLRRNGVEVILKYPQIKRPFENEIASLIHHLKKQRRPPAQTRRQNKGRIES